MTELPIYQQEQAAHAMAHHARTVGNRHAYQAGPTVIAAATAVCTPSPDGTHTHLNLNAIRDTLTQAVQDITDPAQRGVFALDLAEHAINAYIFMLLTAVEGNHHAYADALQSIAQLTAATLERAKELDGL